VDKPQVLIVDDDRRVRDVLHEIFLSNGYKCLVAQNGREGLEMFGTARPPLTVTDVKMPVMDGVEFLKAARQKDPDAAIIILTGVGDVKTAIESLKHGAHDFILKPVNVEELLIAAERALERRELLIERREYQVTLERRVEEATRDLDAAYKELETTNSRLKEFSFKDDVTGLYNRRFFSIRLEEEISRYRRFNHPVSVVLLDLDGFKDVNDRLGHAAGDEILRDIAQILLKHSRGINVISRYGGDEFVVLLVETPKAGARLYADRIRQVVSTYPFSHGCRITASFGVSSLPEDIAAAPDDIVKTADEALYAAKRAGKNKVAGYEQVVGDRPVESGKQG